MTEEDPICDGHYQVAGYRMDDSIVYLMSTARNRCLATMDAAMSAWGLTTAQLGILKLVLDGCGETAADLCRRYNMDPGAMTRLLDKLEEKGLIGRERSSEDRRVVRITLTDSGREMCERGITAVVDVLNRATQDFSPEALDTFRGSLRRIIANLE